MEKHTYHKSYVLGGCVRVCLGIEADSQVAIEEATRRLNLVSRFIEGVADNEDKSHALDLLNGPTLDLPENLNRISAPPCGCKGK